VSTSSSFNPTRVRLERYREVPNPKVDGGFNPTRVRLERSTLTSRSRQRSFNPTRVRLELVEYADVNLSERRLQPNEGSSGTPSTHEQRVRATRASTQRGFVWNGSLRRSSADARASTQRGFVWNNTDDFVSGTTVQASTQRGFVWNSRGSPMSTTTQCFNPTRVRLELFLLCLGKPVFNASTQRGFVWNVRDGDHHEHPNWLQPNEGSSGTIRTESGR